MDLSGACNQWLQWKPRTSVDNRGTPVYGEVQTVQGRAVAALRDVFGKGDEVVTTQVQVTVLPGSPIQIGDLINDREVVTVGEIRDVPGKLVGYTARTR